MATHSKVIPDERLQKSQVDTLTFKFNITAAKTASQIALQGAPVLFGFDTGDFNQTQTDNMLGTANDVVVATSFGSTAMGSNYFGFIIAHNSAKAVLGARIETIQTTGGTPANSFAYVIGEGVATTALPDAATSKISVSPAGNIYGRFSAGNLDSVTAGTILITIDFIQA